MLLGDAEPLPFDYLIVATGSQYNSFGHDAWPALAPGLKSLDDAQDPEREESGATDVGQDASPRTACA